MAQPGARLAALELTTGENHPPALKALPAAFNGRETASYGQTPIAAQSTRAQHLAG